MDEELHEDGTEALSFDKSQSFSEAVLTLIVVPKKPVLDCCLFECLTGFAVDDEHVLEALGASDVGQEQSQIESLA